MANDGPEQEDNMAIARALFSTPQELLARIADADSGVELTFGEIGIGGASVVSTGMWATAPTATVQDLQVVRAMNIAAAVDLNPPD